MVTEWEITKTVVGNEMEIFINTILDSEVKKLTAANGDDFIFFTPSQ